MIRTAKLIRARTRSLTLRFFEAGPVRSRIWQLIVAMRRHHIGRTASAMAFNLFLALVPTLGLAGWLLAWLLSGNQAAMTSTSLILDLTPGEMHALLARHFERFSLGVAPLVLVGALWLTSSAFHMVMSVLETALRAKRRPWWKKRVMALVCSGFGISALSLSGYGMVWMAGGPMQILRRLLGEHAGNAATGYWLGWLAVFASMTALLAGFFRVAVHRPQVKRRVWPGALVAMGLGGTASIFFGYYVRTLARFTVFYGSLAAVTITLAWLWLWCAAVLLGAELNAQLEENASPQENAEAWNAVPGLAQPPSGSVSPTQIPQFSGKLDET